MVHEDPEPALLALLLCGQQAPFVFRNKAAGHGRYPLGCGDLRRAGRSVLVFDPGDQADDAQNPNLPTGAKRAIRR
jgi:hypothetical protein